MAQPTACTALFQHYDGRQAASRAALLARQALARQQLAGQQPDKQSPTLALLFASSSYPAHSVLAGVRDTLPDIPVFGFSAESSFNENGFSTQRAAVLALLSAPGVEVRSDWTEIPHDPSGAADPLVSTKLMDSLGAASGEQSFCLAAGAISHLPERLAPQVLGAASGTPGYALGGAQAGANGLAGALFFGPIAAGLGAAHGWRPTGAYARLTRQQGLTITSLDGMPAVESYARWFNQTTHDWLQPAMQTLLCSYPLGIVGSDGRSVEAVVTPQAFDPDGSLHLLAPAPADALLHLLFADAQSLSAAAEKACRQARSALGSRRPALALVLVSSAWMPVLGPDSAGVLLPALRRALGELPILGAFVPASCWRSSLWQHSSAGPELLQNHILVALLS